MTITDEKRPVAIQIYGKDTEAMVGATRIVSTTGYIRHQLGCPVKKVAGKDAAGAPVYLQNPTNA